MSFAVSACNSLSTVSRARCGVVRPALRSSRRSLRVCAQDKPITEQINELGQNIAEETKKNSGLDEGKLGQQPGNRPAVTGEASEVLSFSGLLPETINGRGAMTAMLAAFIAEVTTHKSVFQQIQQWPVIVAATFGAIVIGSIVPVVRNVDFSTANGAGPFNQQAEIWNGRLAMVAFALLLTVETWKAGPGLVP